MFLSLRNVIDDVEKDVADLFNILRSQPGVSELELRVGSLTKRWVKHVLLFINEQPRDKDIM